MDREKPLIPEPSLIQLLALSTVIWYFDLTWVLIYAVMLVMPFLLLAMLVLIAWREL